MCALYVTVHSKVLIGRCYLTVNYVSTVSPYVRLHIYFSCLVRLSFGYIELYFGCFMLACCQIILCLCVFLVACLVFSTAAIHCWEKNLSLKLLILYQMGHKLCLPLSFLVWIPMCWCMHMWSVWSLHGGLHSQFIVASWQQQPSPFWPMTTALMINYWIDNITTELWTRSWLGPVWWNVDRDGWWIVKILCWLWTVHWQ